MMKHTEGKLDSVGIHIIMDDGGVLLGSMKHNYPQLLSTDQIVSLEEAKANAKRLAVAWNATLGLSNAALEAGVIGEMVKTVKDYQYLVEEDYCGVKQTIEYLRNRLGEVKALLAKLEASDNE